MYNYVCLTCQKPFQSRKKTAKFCSKSCSYKGAFRTREKGNHITKEQMQFCLDNNYGEHRGSKYLKIGIGSYRRLLRKYELNPITKNKFQRVYYGKCIKCNKIALYKGYCGNCRGQIRERLVKQFIINHFFDNRCSKCGLVVTSDTLRVFDFHHENKDKEHNVSQLIKRRKFKRAIKEASKCILVCSNCHRILHNNKNSLDITQERAIIEEMNETCNKYLEELK